MGAGPNHPSTLTTSVVVVQKKPSKKKKKKKKPQSFLFTRFPIVHSEKKYFLVVALRAPQNAVIFFCRCDPTYIGMISYLCNVYSQIRIAQAVAPCS